MSKDTPAAAPLKTAGFSPRFKVPPLVEQGVQMFASRGLGLALAAVGSIWAARSLGPEKLGISGVLVSVIAPLGLLIDFSQNLGLVRRYKAAPTDEDKALLVGQVFAFRWALCLGWMALAIIGLLIFGIPGPEWRTAILAGFPLLLFTINQATWVLQAQENMPASYRALLVQSAVSASCYFLLFRPGEMAAGVDVIVMACAVMAEFCVGWWYAMRPLQEIGGLLRHLKKCLIDWGTTLRSSRSLYWKGRWLAAAGIVNYLYAFVQIPLIGWLLDVQSVGLYRTAGTLVNGVHAFVAIVPVLLYPRMIEWAGQGARVLWQHQLRVVVVASCCFLPLAVIVFAFSPILYRLIYGAEFLPAAYPFAVLVVAKMLMMLGGIYGCGIAAQGHDRWLLLITSITAAISLPLNLLLIPRFGILGAAAVAAASEAVVFFCSLGASWYLLLRAERKKEAP
jgi:O-antigen/teichoic acid export membrane protein